MTFFPPPPKKSKAPTTTLHGQGRLKARKNPFATQAYLCKKKNGPRGPPHPKPAPFFSPPPPPPPKKPTFNQPTKPANPTTASPASPSPPAPTSSSSPLPSPLPPVLSSRPTARAPLSPRGPCDRRFPAASGRSLRAGRLWRWGPPGGGVRGW